MAELAILGFGTVGSGVYEAIQTNQKSIDKRAGLPIHVKKILDLRDFKGTPVEGLMTNNFDDILNDDGIKIVVEVLGGVEPAYTFAKKSLTHGKHVVTSNKELVAKHGAELLALAKENRLNFLFEASVGGGIPIIRPLNKSLTADEITEITGILNGTTNYILTQMATAHKSFEAALKEAQEKGYAEKDPTADVEGHDACRKIAILLSLAIGRQVDFEDIYNEGISKITMTDIAYAAKRNSSIKLLATAKIIDHGVFARVSPVVVPNSHPLSTVVDVFNAIFVRGNVIDEVMFYGKGAGKFPTASAVVADIVDAARHMTDHIEHLWSTEKFVIMTTDNVPVRKLIRVAYHNKTLAAASAELIFGTPIKPIELDGAENEFAFESGEFTEAELNEKIAALREANSVSEIPNTIRLY
jgi:homoserine dehydrogenase